MNTLDPESRPDPALNADEVRRHLRRLLKIVATRLAKRWVQEQPSLTAAKNQVGPSRLRGEQN